MKKPAGLYLVLNPMQEWEQMLISFQEVLEAGLSLVQVWNRWPEELSDDSKNEFLLRVKNLAVEFDVQVLLNEDWKLAIDLDLDGVHLDVIPQNWTEAKDQLKDKIVGITVGNDLELVRWADENQLAYISFCSVFPSSSTDVCELVLPENIQLAREITSLPIFLAGGIRPENLSRLESYAFEGIAVISGILNERNPRAAANSYLQYLKAKP